MPHTLWLAIGFALIHLASKHLKFLKSLPRSRLLSAAGGIAVAYVFLRTLPELGDYQLGSAKLQLNLKFTCLLCLVWYSFMVCSGWSAHLQDRPRGVERAVAFFGFTWLPLFSTMA